MRPSIRGGSDDGIYQLTLRLRWIMSDVFPGEQIKGGQRRVYNTETCLNADSNVSTLFPRGNNLFDSETKPVCNDTRIDLNLSISEYG